MCKKTKIMLMIATSLVLVGSIIFGGVMTMFKWDFSKLSTVKYETNEHVISEAYRNISVKTVTADISFVPAEDGKCKVICHEDKNAKHVVSVKDGTLTIELVDMRKWYQHLGMKFDLPKITVYLPQGEYGTLSANLTTGKVDIAKDFKFASMEIKGTTGDITNHASVSGSIKVKTTTGDISAQNISVGALDLSVTTGKVNISNVTCEGDMSVKVSTGKTNMSDVTCKNLISNGTTGGISLRNVVAAEKLTIKRTTGNVAFDRCDAGEILVQSTTGSVKGTLLSEKVFFTHSDTGRVEVPETITGGKCKITTDTGNIKIEIA